MIRLELSNDEQRLLSEALSSYVADLRSEIVHTDRTDLKDALKQRRALLQHLLEALRAPEASEVAR